MTNNYLKKAEELAKARYEGDGIKAISAKGEHSYVKFVKLLESEVLTKLLDDYRVYGIEVYNPYSQIAGRPYFHYSLAVNTKNDDVAYLENDKQAIQFISKQQFKIEEKRDMEDVMSLFGLIRGYEICTEQLTDLGYYYEYPDYMKDATEWDYTDKKWNETDWEYVIKKDKNNWVVYVTFLHDPYIYGYSRYKFEISEKGNIRIISLKGTAKSAYR